MNHTLDLTPEDHRTKPSEVKPSLQILWDMNLLINVANCFFFHGQNVAVKLWFQESWAKDPLASHPRILCVGVILTCTDSLRVSGSTNERLIWHTLSDSSTDRRTSGTCLSFVFFLLSKKTSKLSRACMLSEWGCYEMTGCFWFGKKAELKVLSVDFTLGINTGESWRSCWIFPSN